MVGRGGKRPGAGRPKVSKYGEDGGIPIRIPASLVGEQPDRDFQALAEILKEQGADVARLNAYLLGPTSRFGSHRQLARRQSNQLYRRVDYAVAAGFDASSAVEADDATWEEFDPYTELGDPGKTIIIPVRGDSMIDAGIHSGDELVVERIDYPMRVPNTGDIVIARLDGSLTVKTYKSLNGKAFLIPENADLEPIELEDGKMEFHVFGIVRKLIRSL